MGLKDPVHPSSSALDDPNLLDQLLLYENDINGHSRRDLRILRNMVYARRGRIFRSPTLQEHFSRMDWYRPDTRYTDARLTRIDRQNIKIIRDGEDQIGGPVADASHQDADATAFWFYDG